jgi:hypothetical protein
MSATKQEARQEAQRLIQQDGKPRVIHPLLGGSSWQVKLAGDSSMTEWQNSFKEEVSVALIDHNKLQAIVNSVPEDKKQPITDLVTALNEMVNYIEHSGRVQMTKDWYGDYLDKIHSRTDLAMYLIAGANKRGLQAVAMILGL